MALDFSALTAPVTREEARAADSGSASAGIEDSSRRELMWMLLSVCGVLLVIGVVMAIVQRAWWPVWGMPGGIGIVGAIIPVLELRRSSPARALRMERFAADNGFSFARRKAGAGYRGAAFTHGRDHARSLVVSTRRRGRPVEIGNLRFTEGGPRTFVRQCGYVALRATGSLSHIVVEAGHRRQVTQRRMPLPPHPSQIVDVGAGRAFTVYAADGAEDVARALFDAENRERFRRLARWFDVEFVEDTMLLTSRRLASRPDPVWWTEMMGLVDDVAASVSTWPVWATAREKARSGSTPALRVSRWRQSKVGVLALAVTLPVATAIALVVTDNLPW